MSWLVSTSRSTPSGTSPWSNSCWAANSWWNADASSPLVHPINMASREELEWWNKFAAVMAEQWMLTPAMNAIIRTDYERDYAEYLFRPRGSFLEIGCGTGWIGHKFAERGMQVDGIDFSDGQLEIARARAAGLGLTDVAYFVRD